MPFGTALISGQRRKYAPGSQRSHTAGPSTARSQGCLISPTRCEPRRLQRSWVALPASVLPPRTQTPMTRSPPICPRATAPATAVPSRLPAVCAAVLQCGQNSDPSGPVFAKYLLFNSSTDLTSSFTSSLGSDTLTNCGDAKSPTTWHQGSSTDSAGQVACGTYQGQAEVIWTTDAKNVMSLIRGIQW